MKIKQTIELTFFLFTKPLFVPVEEGGFKLCLVHISKLDKQLKGIFALSLFTRSYFLIIARL